MLALLAQLPQEPFVRPHIDWHAVAPELVLLGFGALITLLDVVALDRARRWIPALTGVSFLAAMVPVLTLAYDGTDRVLWDGAFVTDQYALVMKGLFLISAYVIVLLSQNYIAEGDYYESEYYQLITASVLGGVVMASARDLITIFIAIELVSIPAFLMAAWRKRDLKSNEAGLKFMLMGVFATGVMLYGMSLLYGTAADTRLAVIADSLGEGTVPLFTLGVVFTLVGFGFKVSAVPFHAWAPDTYEGAPTPLTAFLAVASKAAGFVALLNVVMVAFPPQEDVVEPLMWVLSALTMTIGNLIALRQTNIVRMLAYSGIGQAGYILAPLAVFGSVPERALSAVVTYLIIYAAMNLGAFAVVIAAARKTRSGEIASYGGLFQYAPGLTVAMTFFLFSLVGIPPFGGWYAKFAVFQALVSADQFWGYTLAVVLVVNSVIAAFYYTYVARQMWFEPIPDGDRTPVRIPAALGAALVITAVITIGTGILPGLVSDATEFGDLGDAAAVTAAVDAP